MGPNLFREGRRFAFEGGGERASECSIAARFFFLFPLVLPLCLCVLEPSLRNCTCQSATIRLRAREGREAGGGARGAAVRPSPWRRGGDVGRHRPDARPHWDRAKKRWKEERSGDSSRNGCSYPFSANFVKRPLTTHQSTQRRKCPRREGLSWATKFGIERRGESERDVTIF